MAALRARGLPHGLDRRRVGLAEHPRRDGEGHDASSRSARPRGALHAAGIEVGFFLQFGYPGETREDIERTRALVRECAPDDIGISVSYPLPGTRSTSACSAELGAKQNWDDSDDLAMLYRGPFPTEFYRELHRVVHHEFRLRRPRGRRSAAAALGRPRSTTRPRCPVSHARLRAPRPPARTRASAPLAAVLTRAQAAVPSEQG